MTRLLGYKRFKAEKTQRDICIMFVAQDISQREKEHGYVGQKIVEMFIPESQIGLLKPSDIGKELLLDYELSGNRAYLVNVAVK